MGAEEGEVIQHSFVNRAIANAQKRVEGQNFESRKHLLDYDNVMNEQRSVVYKLRRRALEGENMREEILTRLEDAVDIKVSQFIDEGDFEESWDLAGLQTELERGFNLKIELGDPRDTTADALLDKIIAAAKEQYSRLEKVVDTEEVRNWKGVFCC
jgi:preprotein translocase subunit SecA